MSTVWIMVDDTDPRLNYTGSWSFLPLSGQGESFSGPIYNDTLHGTSANSTVSFRFNGSSNVGVYGTMEPSFNVPTASFSLNPNVSCWLDGAAIQSPQLPDNATITAEGIIVNNILTCLNNVNASESGEHELLISTSIAPGGSPPWLLDYITFESMLEPSLDGEVLQAGNGQVGNPTNYSMLTFGPGWTHIASSVFTENFMSSVTNITHSSATMKFNGKLLVYLIQLGRNIDFEPLQVDDNAPVVFKLSGASTIHDGPLLDWLNQPLFNTSNLNAAEHTVVVTFNGNSTVPLAISYFYVTSLTTSQQHSHPSHTIEEAALGVVIPILLLIAMTILWYRRKMNYKREFKLSTAYPFIYRASDSTSSPFTFKDLIVPSRKSREKGLTLSVDPDSNRNIMHINQPNPMNVSYMKLQQRLVVLEGRAQQREHNSAGATPQQQQVMSVTHTDTSELWLNGEVLEANLEMEEVPPGYTAD